MRSSIKTDAQPPLTVTSRKSFFSVTKDGVGASGLSCRPRALCRSSPARSMMPPDPPIDPEEAVMLVLTRKPKEKIQIGGNITVTILRATRRQVSVGIEAPDSIRVIRTELSSSNEATEEYCGLRPQARKPKMSAGRPNGGS